MSSTVGFPVGPLGIPEDIPSGIVPSRGGGALLLINIFYSWFSCRCSTWHSARHPRRHTCSVARASKGGVGLSRRGRCPALESFQFLLQLLLCRRRPILVQPLFRLLQRRLERLGDYIVRLGFLYPRLHRVYKRFKTILGLYLFAQCIVLGLVLLGLLHHALNLFLGQLARLILDRNILAFARTFLQCRHI